MTHMSSPKTLEDNSGKQTAHADYIYEEIKTFGLDFDTEIEAKAKDWRHFIVSCSQRNTEFICLLFKILLGSIQIQRAI